ncbi:MAG TPA: EamA family transporter [Vitreimonas sp.]|nr:EamA family transporter [Vitreimonas sp.]
MIWVYIKAKGLELRYPNVKDKTVFYVALSALLVRVAEVAYTLGIATGQTAIVAPIGGSYPTLFVVLAFLIFKDRLTRQQLAGIMVTLMGVVGLASTAA